MAISVGKMPEVPADARVWRYLSLAALIDILQRRCMFFPRLDKLDDPYEGSVPMAVRKYLRTRLIPQDELLQKFEREAQAACVSCWHINDAESAAMWKLYAHKSGVAIRSSFGGLNGGFRYEGLEMAGVDYIDFDDVRDLPSLHPAFLKRKIFSHEKELRLVIYEPDKGAYEHGKHVPVVLEKLVEEVHVSPAEPQWLDEVVRRELGQHGVAAEVKRLEPYSRTLK